MTQAILRRARHGRGRGLASLSFRSFRRISTTKICSADIPARDRRERLNIMARLCGIHLDGQQRLYRLGAYTTGILAASTTSPHSWAASPAAWYDAGAGRTTSASSPAALVGCISSSSPRCAATARIVARRGRA